jgi:hypothetical protein
MCARVSLGGIGEVIEGADYECPGPRSRSPVGTPPRVAPALYVPVENLRGSKEPVAERGRAERGEKWMEPGRDCHPVTRVVVPGLDGGVTISVHNRGIVMIMTDSNRP